MIQGLLIELKTDELKQHIVGRADYHKKKAEWYEAQIKNLKQGGLEETHASNDPVSSLERSHHDHREKYGYFMFMAEHLIPDETYRLTEHDLSKLEFVSRYF